MSTCTSVSVYYYLDLGSDELEYEIRCMVHPGCQGKMYGDNPHPPEPTEVEVLECVRTVDKRKIIYSSDEFEKIIRGIENKPQDWRLDTWAYEEVMRSDYA